jgi:multidrug efflux pump subunit AcrA (membrane-fusion protein)
VYNVGQLEMVKILGEGNVIKKRAVKTGKKFDGMIEILSGIKPGEKVMSAPKEGEEHAS